jgi:hypothetical protein
MAKLSILKELWEFIKHKKKYWLIPIVITIILMGVLLVLTEGTAIAPFIYTLF